MLFGCKVHYRCAQRALSLGLGVWVQPHSPQMHTHSLCHCLASGPIFPWNRVSSCSARQPSSGGFTIRLTDPVRRPGRFAGGTVLRAGYNVLRRGARSAHQQVKFFVGRALHITVRRAGCAVACWGHDHLLCRGVAEVRAQFGERGVVLVCVWKRCESADNVGLSRKVCSGVHCKSRCALWGVAAAMYAAAALSMLGLSMLLL